MPQKNIGRVFFVLTAASLFSALLYCFGLLYPFLAIKALAFRRLVVLALPFYIYLVISAKHLRPLLKNPVSFLLLLFLVANIVTIFTGVNWPRSFWGNDERMGGVYQLMC